MFSLHAKGQACIFFPHVKCQKHVFSGKRIFEIAPDNANNSHIGKCFESRHCTRYYPACLMLSILNQFFFYFFLNVSPYHYFRFYFAGAAVGFKLDSLLKLSDTRARNNKMTLMHYLCKVETLKIRLFHIYICIGSWDNVSYHFLFFLGVVPLQKWYFGDLGKSFITVVKFLSALRKEDALYYFVIPGLPTILPRVWVGKS